MASCGRVRIYIYIFKQASKLIYINISKWKQVYSLLDGNVTHLEFGEVLNSDVDVDVHLWLWNLFSLLNVFYFLLSSFLSARPVSHPGCSFLFFPGRRRRVICTEAEIQGHFRGAGPRPEWYDLPVDVAVCPVCSAASSLPLSIKHFHFFLKKLSSILLFIILIFYLKWYAQKSYL